MLGNLANMRIVGHVLRVVVIIEASFCLVAHATGLADELRIWELVIGFFVIDYAAVSVAGIVGISSGSPTTDRSKALIRVRFGGTWGLNWLIKVEANG